MADGTLWLAPLVPALEALQRETEALAKQHQQLLAHNDRVCMLAQRQAQVVDNLTAIAAGATQAVAALGPGSLQPGGGRPGAGTHA